MATVINLEENIGKTVGRTRNSEEDPFAAYRRILGLAKPLHRPVPYPRGVFRFKTHEEADQWQWNYIMKAALTRQQIERDAPGLQLLAEKEPKPELELPRWLQWLERMFGKPKR